MFLFVHSASGICTDVVEMGVLINVAGDDDDDDYRGSNGAAVDK